MGFENKSTQPTKEACMGVGSEAVRLAGCVFRTGNDVNSKLKSTLQWQGYVPLGVWPQNVEVRSVHQDYSVVYRPEVDPSNTIMIRSAQTDG